VDEKGKKKGVTPSTGTLNRGEKALSWEGGTGCEKGDEVGKNTTCSWGTLIYKKGPFLYSRVTSTTVGRKRLHPVLKLPRIPISKKEEDVVHRKGHGNTDLTTTGFSINYLYFGGKIT